MHTQIRNVYSACNCLVYTHKVTSLHRNAVSNKPVKLKNVSTWHAKFIVGCYAEYDLDNFLEQHIIMHVGLSRKGNNHKSGGALKTMTNLHSFHRESDNKIFQKLVYILSLQAKWLTSKLDSQSV